MFRNEIDSSRRYDTPCSSVYHDDRASMRGALIEATFEPVWVEYSPWAPSKGVKRAVPEEPQRPVPRFGWSQGGQGGAVIVDGHIVRERIQPLGAPMEEVPQAAPEAAPPPATAKKPRRVLGLAVGLGKETSVMVQSMGKTGSE